MYQCKTMEDVLSREWALIKQEEDPAYYHQHPPQFGSHVARNDRISRDDKPYQRPRGGKTSNRSDKIVAQQPLNRSIKEKRPSLTWPDINNILLSHANLVGVLKADGWNGKMASIDKNTILET